MIILKEWWLLKRFEERPKRFVKMHMVKKIDNEEKIKNYSYLKGLAPGWYGLQYGILRKKRGGLKPFSMRTFWHIVPGKGGKLYAERWIGSIANQTFVKKIPINYP